MEQFTNGSARWSPCGGGELEQRVCGVAAVDVWKGTTIEHHRHSSTEVVAAAVAAVVA